MIIDGFVTVTPDSGYPNINGENVRNTCTQNNDTSGRSASYIFVTSPTSVVTDGTECDATIDIHQKGKSVNPPVTKVTADVTMTLVTGATDTTAAHGVVQFYVSQIDSYTCNYGCIFTQDQVSSVTQDIPEYVGQGQMTVRFTSKLNPTNLDRSKRVVVTYACVVNDNTGHSEQQTFEHQISGTEIQTLTQSKDVIFSPQTGTTKINITGVGTVMVYNV